MGVCQSAPKFNTINSSTQNINTHNPNHNPSSSGRLSTEQLASRIAQPPNSISAVLGSSKVRYAHLSQRGYYPDDVDKANQDAFTIIKDYTGIEGDYFFGVFDGHGKDGDSCAIFAQSVLPRCQANEIDNARKRKKARAAKANVGAVAKQNAPEHEEILTIAEYEAACIQAHIKTNIQMHASPNVEDSLSGTTSISVIFHGKYMTVCNLGDSRAIVGQVVLSSSSPGTATRNMNKNAASGMASSTSGLRAYPLSRDQTPYRKDERERVKKYGARILSLDQIEGLEPVHENWGDVNLGEEIDEGGDPPRIWSPNGEYPGTAFTRSLGDGYAEELGVFAEPEVISREVSIRDKIVVLASDGVFEFLTNQSVIDMCAKFQDPLEACRAVVAESYELWLQYELRTDDITMIAIFIDEGLSGRDLHSENPNDAIELQSILLEGVRPVRRTLSRGKKKAMVLARSAKEDEDFDISKYVTPKTDHEKARIAEAIKASFLFQHITPANREILFSVMEKVKVKAGELIIRQGDEGDRFYIVDNGRYQVRIQDPNNLNESGLGKVVHVYTSAGTQSNNHPSFGELALMYATPRAASITAETDGQLWALHRNIFRKVLMRRSGRKELITALRRIELLRALNVQQFQQLADCMTAVTFKKGEAICTLGEVENSLFVIKAGSVDLTDGSEGIESLRESDFFGEHGILKGGPRQFTAIAVAETTCMTIAAPEFEAMIGSLEAIIAADKKCKQERSVALSGAGPPLRTIKRFGAIMEDEVSLTLLCKSSGHGQGGSEKAHTLKVFYKKLIVKTSQQEAVMRDIDLLRVLSKSKEFVKCSSVTNIVSTYTDRDCLYVLYDHPACCNLATILDDHQNSILPENIAKHVTMSIFKALEAIHKNQVVYRGLSPDSIGVTAEGQVLLLDFHHARQNPEGNVTICGSPEYLSPEVVQQQGHGLPSDFWMLGVIVFEMLVGKTPFHTASEIDIYAKICRHVAGTIEIPNASDEVVNFVDKLLNPDPNSRLGSKGTAFDKDRWFATASWKKMNCPELVREAVIHMQERLESTDATVGKVEVYDGDNEWCENF